MKIAIFFILLLLSSFVEASNRLGVNWVSGIEKGNGVIEFKIRHVMLGVGKGEKAYYLFEGCKEGGFAVELNYKSGQTIFERKCLLSQSEYNSNGLLLIKKGSFFKKVEEINSERKELCMFIAGIDSSNQLRINISGFAACNDNELKVHYLALDGKRKVDKVQVKLKLGDNYSDEFDYSRADAKSIKIEYSGHVYTPEKNPW